LHFIALHRSSLHWEGKLGVRASRFQIIRVRRQTDYERIVIQKRIFGNG
jgi:hypothetical protein